MLEEVSQAEPHQIIGGIATGPLPQVVGDLPFDLLRQRPELVEGTGVRELPRSQPLL